MSQPFQLLQEGLQERNSRKLLEAERLYSEAVQSQPNQPHAWNILAVIAESTRRLDQAEQHARRAISLNAGQAEYHNTLGVVLKGKGQLGIAIASFREALARSPNYVPACDNLAACLYDAGRYLEAEPFLAKAADRNPNDFVAQFRYGQTLNQIYKCCEGEQVLRGVLRLRPNLPEAHAELGRGFLIQGRLPEAREALERALQLQPRKDETRLSICHLLSGAGDTERAVHHYREILKDDSAHARVLFNLGIKLGRDVSETDLKTLKQLTRAKEITERDRAGVHYALALVTDAKRGFAAAATHAANANGIMKRDLEMKGFRYARRNHEKFVERVIKTYSASHLSVARDSGNSSRRPIFIVGLPRSGTSLVEQMLASHPQVFGAGELRLIPFSLDALPLRAHAPKDVFKCVRQLGEADVKRCADDVLERLTQINDNSPYLTDKAPENYLHLGWIAMLFPKARIINCVRDLRDTAVSCWMNRLVEIYWANDLKDIAHNFTQYVRLMQHWRRALPLQILDVSYGTLVANPEPTCRRLVEHCGLPWDSACLDFHKARRAVLTASSSQVRQPMYSTSLNRWQHYEKELKPIIEDLDLQNRILMKESSYSA